VHFLIYAWDAKGDHAVAKRDALRPVHAATIKALFDEGHVVLGAGLLDDDGVVRGSLVIVDFPSRDDVDTYLASEPFATEGLWDRVEVHPLRVPDFYLSR
jgi:uncharacterized protein